jgi:hypothetical protein
MKFTNVVPHNATSPTTGYTHVDHMMAEASHKYTSDPQQVAVTRTDATAKLPRPLPPTPEDLDLAERTDSAVSKTERLIREAKAQLAKPVSDYLPKQLTAAEVAEKREAENWREGLEASQAAVGDVFVKNEALLEDVMDLISELEEGRIPVQGIVLPTPPSVPPRYTIQVPIEVGDWLQDSRETQFVEYTDSSLAEDRWVKQVRTGETEQQRLATITSDLQEAQRLEKAVEQDPDEAKATELGRLYEQREAGLSEDGPKRKNTVKRTEWKNLFKCEF